MHCQQSKTKSVWLGNRSVIVIKLIICCLQRYREPGAGYPGEQSPRQERVNSMNMAWMLMTQCCVGCVQFREQMYHVVKHNLPNAVNTLQLQWGVTISVWCPRKCITSLQQFAICFYFATCLALELFPFFFFSYTSLLKRAMAVAEQEELCFVLIHVNTVALCSLLAFWMVKQLAFHPASYRPNMRHYVVWRLWSLLINGIFNGLSEWFSIIQKHGKRRERQSKEWVYLNSHWQINWHSSKGF